MKVILNIAEKPSIAKQISFYLSNNNSQKNFMYSKYNPIFKFNRNFQGQNCQMIVTSVTGHIMNLRFHPNTKNWNTIDPIKLLTTEKIYFDTTFDKKNLEKNILELSESVTDLFLWLDCDREGEAIAYEVINICKRTNNNLKIHRAQFSSLQKSEILYAFDNPIPPNPNQKDAVICRQEIDLRTGAAFTRMQTLLLQQNFNEVSLSKTISYGPCQFPTLSFIVQRYLDNINFVAEKFYYLNLVLEKKGIKTQFNWKKEKHFDQYIISILYEDMMKDNKVVIKKINSKQGKKFKPYPLTTVELQKLAVRKLGMTSKEIMSIAEKLYTSGYISYPRTETNIFPKTMDFKQLLKRLEGVDEYYDYLKDLKFDYPRKGKKSDQAHPPIHPVKAYDKPKNTKEYKIYDLVARRFIANCSNDAITSEVEIKAFIQKEEFTAHGLQIVERNFLDIYEKFYYLKEKQVGKFQEGEILNPQEFTLKSGKTTAPPLLGESDLIQLMDKNGVGTDATIHEHIHTIIERRYCILKNKKFIPTQLGIALLSTYEFLKIPLANPFKRSQNEKLFTQIAEGEITKDQVLQEIMEDMIENYQNFDEKKEFFLKEFQKFFNQFKSGNQNDIQTNNEFVFPNFQQSSLENTQMDLFNCNKCQAKIILKKSKKGNLFLSCQQYPVCKNSYFFSNYNNFLSMKKINKKCNKCQTYLLEIQTKDNETIYHCYLNCSNSIQKIIISADSIGNNKSKPQPQKKTKRKCGKCRQPGHNSRNCPTNQIIMIIILLIDYILTKCRGCKRFFKVNTLCGFDGITYKNECYAKCNETGIKHVGACSVNYTPCNCPSVTLIVFDFFGNSYLNECVANCYGKDVIRSRNYNLNSFQQKSIPLIIRDDPIENQNQQIQQPSQLQLNFDEKNIDIISIFQQRYQNIFNQQFQIYQKQFFIKQKLKQLNQ